MKINLEEIKKSVFYSQDLHRKITVKNYLLLLLEELWTEEENFSGKRPLGNSGWQGDVAVGLIKNGFIKGKIDDDGYLEDYNEEEFNRLMIKVIKNL